MRIVIAGITGSIGTQTIDVISRLPEIEVVGATVGSDWFNGERLCRSLDCGMLAVAAPDGMPEDLDGITTFTGVDSGARLVAEVQPDVVLNAVVGFAGLAVSISALECGASLALANKESLVAGGELVTALAGRNGAAIVPVDSEHAALAQLLEGLPPDSIEKVTITASGGPFRGRKSDELAGTTVEEALAHPTWSMGGKISIDSATLMNKGLEVIEAHHLFGIDYDRIGVVVHPQSIVHALVGLVDGMQLAHMGLPDMRSPIAWSLTHPDHLGLPIERLDLASVGALEFEAPDRETFRCLDLAIEAGRAGGTAPCILNAANEVAVDAFLSGRIGFMAIPDTVEATLETVAPSPALDFETVSAADTAARVAASAAVDAIERP